MSSYERLPLSDEPSESNATLNTTTTTTVPTPTPASAVDGPSTLGSSSARDGVFNNLRAKADDAQAPSSKAHPEGKTYAELEPPSYAEAAHDRVPTYYETTVVSSGVAEDGQVLIDGLPVGDFFSFVVNMLVSMSFDFIGFLLTAMLATSHAARAGSRVGFGVTLVRYGVYMRTREDEMIQQFDDQYEPETSPAELAQEEDELKAENAWLSYIFIFLGFFIIMRANAEYVRAKRMQAVILASSDIATA
ncbi:hypothetical protein PhCBS80983_g03031 [Powellomyces hirtus]|uniref:Uncharacterized protein n=1 Tax=Powellomyces hirtus TaxID=109895 RepID=A0A507E3F1_9FUNG|nr:hypothetical protein PhCBS80983_g03031 [Powellomyces hirtus]